MSGRGCHQGIKAAATEAAVSRYGCRAGGAAKSLRKQVIIISSIVAVVTQMPTSPCQDTLSRDNRLPTSRRHAAYVNQKICQCQDAQQAPRSRRRLQGRPRPSLSGCSDTTTWSTRDRDHGDHGDLGACVFNEACPLEWIDLQKRQTP